jgi:hypothetical protein
MTDRDSGSQIKSGAVGGESRSYRSGSRCRSDESRSCCRRKLDLYTVVEVKPLLKCL